MDCPAWFDQSYYLTCKAAQLNAQGFQGRTDWSTTEVLNGIEAEGLTPFEHYARYGADEGLNIPPAGSTKPPISRTRPRP